MREKMKYMPVTFVLETGYEGKIKMVERKVFFYSCQNFYIRLDLFTFSANIH